MKRLAGRAALPRPSNLFTLYPTPTSHSYHTHTSYIPL